MLRHIKKMFALVLVFSCCLSFEALASDEKNNILKDKSNLVEKNLFYPNQVVDGALITQEGNQYFSGAYVGSFMLGAGSTVNNFVIVSQTKGSLEYKKNLNGKYSFFEVVVAPSYVWNKIGNQTDVGRYKIVCDGKVVSSLQVNKGDEDQKIRIDLKGVKEIIIKAEGKSLCFFDPVLK